MVNLQTFTKRQLLKSAFVTAVFTILLFRLTISVFAQQQQEKSLVPASNQPSSPLTSAQFIGQNGLTIDKLIELGFGRRADLLAARQRVAVASGQLRQAGLRLNPTLDGEFGSPRLLGGDPEIDLSVGVTQVFETNGKRPKRIAVAELELQKARLEVVALERIYAAGVRQNYANAIAAGRQLDVLEKLIAVSEQTVKATQARLEEGDVAPLDNNLVRVENDRLKVQAIEARSELETNLLLLKTLIGSDVAEDLRLAPQSERPPRLDLGLAELTEIALRSRADLRAAQIGEELGTARINLANAQKTPNFAASARYSRNKSIADLPQTAGGGFAVDSDNELTFGVSIEIPAFNRNQGGIASAVAERGQATQNREFLEATIKRDVAVNFRKYRAAAETLVLYSTQILPRSEENLRSVRAAYGFGEFSVFDVVNEQRRLTENVTGYNNAVRNYYNALTDLETALGSPIPPSGFAPQTTSVLPDEVNVPNQFSKEKLMQSLFQTTKKEKK